MTKRLHIGIDANEANLTQNRVGINQYAFNLLHALYALPTSHSYTIYLKTPPLADLPKEKDGWHYRVIPFPKLWTQTRLPFDLFIHHPRPDVFLSLTHYAPRFSPIPTIVSIMDLGFLTSREQFTSKDYNQLTSWTKYSVSNASAILAISQFTKQDIIKHYAIDQSKIVVSLLGYDKSLFKPTKNPKLISSLGIKSPYFLYLGSLKPSKNIEMLIRSFAAFPGREYSLVISGKKAWLYDQIFSQVKNLQIEDRVIFTGFVDETTVPVLMSHAAAFVMPSLYEGFGIPVLEAMACGTPVVVSNIASLPEVVGEAGIYVDPLNEESITKGLSIAVSNQRTKFVRNGLERVKLFDWLNTAKITVEVLERVTKK